MDLSNIRIGIIDIDTAYPILVVPVKSLKCEELVGVFEVAHNIASIRKHSFLLLWWRRRGRVL